MSSALVDMFIIGTFMFFVLGFFFTVMIVSNYKNKKKEKKTREQILDDDFKRFMEEKDARWCELYGVGLNDNERP